MVSPDLAWPCSNPTRPHRVGKGNLYGVPRFPQISQISPDFPLYGVPRFPPQISDFRFQIFPDFHGVPRFSDFMVSPDFPRAGFGRAGLAKGLNAGESFG